MKFVRLSAGLCCLAIALSAGNSQADDKTAALTPFLPDDINTVYVLRLGQMIESPKAEKENWSSQLAQGIAEGRGDLPPWIDTLIVGSLTHPNVPEEVWATGVLLRPDDVSFASIAAHFGSNIDQLAGKSVVQTQRNSYMVDFPDRILGFFRPANRQELAGWIRDSDPTSSPQYAEYLQLATSRSDDLIMALNLQDMLDPQFVKQRLLEDDRFARHQELIDQLVPLLTGLRGVTLTANIDDKILCEISIDCSEPVGASASILKTLFLAMIEDAGAMIDEFPTSRIQIAGNSVKLTCELSDDSLRRLVSLIVPPKTPHEPVSQPTSSDGTESKTEQTPQDELIARQKRADRRYLSSVNEMINNLYRSSRRADTYAKTLTWHQTFASKIEALPTKDVRPELLEFGNRTVDRFRALASSLRGQGIKVEGQNNALTYAVTGYDPGWAYANYWGGVGYRPPSVDYKTNIIEVREKQAAAVQEGELARAKIWEAIRADQQAMKDLPPRS